MKVWVVHNRYQQPGGEDQVFLAETTLLESFGHRVVRYITHNDRVADMNRLALAGNTLWNSSTYQELRALIRRKLGRVAIGVGRPYPEARIRWATSRRT